MLDVQALSPTAMCMRVFFMVLPVELAEPFWPVSQEMLGLSQI